METKEKEALDILLSDENFRNRIFLSMSKKKEQTDNPNQPLRIFLSEAFKDEGWNLDPDVLMQEAESDPRITFQTLSKEEWNKKYGTDRSNDENDSLELTDEQLEQIAGGPAPLLYFGVHFAIAGAKCFVAGNAAGMW